MGRWVGNSVGIEVMLVAYAKIFNTTLPPWPKVGWMINSFTKKKVSTYFYGMQTNFEAFESFPIIIFFYLSIYLFLSAL